MAIFRSVMYLGFIAVAVAGWFFKRQSKVSHSTSIQAPTLQNNAPINLQAALKDARWQIRLEAVQAIRENQTPENLKLLLSMLLDPDSDVSEAVIAGVAEYGHDALEDLQHIFQTGNRVSREAVLKTLLQLQDPASQSILIAALHDESAWVRIPAAQTLGILGGEEAQTALIQALTDEHPDALKAVRTALKQIGTPKALAALGSQPQVKH